MVHGAPQMTKLDPRIGAHVLILLPVFGDPKWSQEGGKWGGSKMEPRGETSSQIYPTGSQKRCESKNTSSWRSGCVPGAFEGGPEQKSTKLDPQMSKCVSKAPSNWDPKSVQKQEKIELALWRRSMSVLGADRTAKCRRCVAEA